MSLVVVTARTWSTECAVKETMLAVSINASKGHGEITSERTVPKSDPGLVSQ